METLLEPLATTATAWHAVCVLDDILPGTGVAALIGRRQIAIFRPADDGTLFATANFDPFSRAMVLSRGLVGEAAGAWFVASPVYKQRFRLADGACLDDAAIAISTYPVRCEAGRVLVAVPT